MIIALFAATILMADSTTALQTAPAPSPAPQAGAAATAPDNAKPKKTAANGLVCKTEPVLGTRLPTKKCRSVEQMAQQRQEDQANLDKMQRVDQPGH